MQESRVSLRPMQKPKSEELPWRNSRRARCDIHAGVTCGLLLRMHDLDEDQVRAGIKAARFQGRNPDKQNPVEHIEQSSDQSFVECDCCLVSNKVIEEWINCEHYFQYTS